jgi:hypothetical protein
MYGFKFFYGNNAGTTANHGYHALLPSLILPSRIPKAQHKYKQKKKQNSKTFVKVQELKHITAY